MKQNRGESRPNTYRTIAKFSGFTSDRKKINTIYFVHPHPNKHLVGTSFTEILHHRNGASSLPCQTQLPAKDQVVTENCSSSYACACMQVADSW
jgi:hypothetical protein